jgi:hypothetical protein
MKDDRTWQGVVPWIYGKIPAFRSRRFSRFLAELNPQAKEKIIDLGGEPEFWKKSNIEMEVHCVNLDKLEFIQDEYLVKIKTSAGDCCDLFDEKDNSYDIVFSNSVIEHVGDLQKQKHFFKFPLSH